MTTGITGTLNATVSMGTAMVAFTTATVDLGHKRDVDMVEDGCIGRLSISLQAGSGCRLQVGTSNVVDSMNRFQIQDVILAADSQCPNFLDADEGTFRWSGSTTDAINGWVTITPPEISDYNVASSCVTGATVTVHIDSLNGQARPVIASEIVIRGNYTSDLTVTPITGGQVLTISACPTVCMGTACPTSG